MNRLISILSVWIGLSGIPFCYKLANTLVDRGLSAYSSSSVFMMGFLISVALCCLGIIGFLEYYLGDDESE